MAEVCRAYDQTERRDVALKLLRAHRSHDAARLKREYQVLASLAHPQIVEAFAFGLSEDGPFYTMESLEHGDLRSLERPVPIPRVCEVASPARRRLVVPELATVRAPRRGRGQCPATRPSIRAGFEQCG